LGSVGVGDVAEREQERRQDVGECGLVFHGV
jgi:hypothetical protein